MSHKALFLLARTAPPGAALQAAVAERGLRLVHCALVQTQAQPINAALSVLFEAARNADWHVFVSPQAARAAASLMPKIFSWPGRFAAVGLATADALRGAGFCPNQHPVMVPARGEGAQALLDMPELQQLNGATVAIYAAPDGLPLLAGTLAQRGAQILVVPVYRRIALTLTSAQKKQCNAAELAYVGSVAFLDALISVRGGKPLAVLAPSARVASAARALGCAALVCESTNDQAIAAKISDRNFCGVDFFKHEIT